MAFYLPTQQSGAFLRPEALQRIALTDKVGWVTKGDSVSSPRMPSPEDGEIASNSADELPNVLRRALLEAADLQDLEVRAHELSEKTRIGAEARAENESAPIT